MTEPAHTHRLLFGFTMPMRLVSETNQREHHMARHRRRKAQRAAATLAFRSALGQAGMQAGMQWSHTHVIVTRIAPRFLDGHDNLQSSCKAVVDGIADAMGVNDGSGVVRWAYRQEHGKPKEYACMVQVFG